MAKQQLKGYGRGGMGRKRTREECANVWSHDVEGMMWIMMWMLTHQNQCHVGQKSANVLGVWVRRRGRGNLSAIKSGGVCEFLSNTALVGTA